MADTCCETERCETPSTGRSTEGCPCGTSGCSGEPIDCAVGMWSGSFFQALKATQVEFLKAKIQKAWGAKMDKAADAVLEAMGAQWQAMLAQSSAKAQLKERLAALWKESK